MRLHFPTALCACLLLAACGSDKTATSSTQPGEDGLPQPETAGGSVTGMPNPGAPSAQPPPLPEPPAEDEVLIDEGMDAPTPEPSSPAVPLPPGINGEMEVPPESYPTMPAPAPEPVETRLAPPTDS